jgi:hypothetical protein
MVRRWLNTGGLILTLGAASALVAQQVPAAKTTDAAKPATKASKNSAKKAKKEVVATPVPVVQAPPPPPPTPEQSPAIAPQVSFQNGELSIRSDNATLSSILTAVKAQTGATVDAPGSTSSDRIATQIGPGDPRDVLTTLLNNSKYDFILLGAPGSPLTVQKIILTARAAGAGNNGGAAAAVNRATPVRNFQVPAEVQQENNDQELPDAEIPDDAGQAEPPQPDQPEQPEQPEPQQQNGQPPTDQSQQPGNPNQPKTPEQLLQELQRMQQQQQQQQEQQRQQNLNPQ